MNKRLIKLGLLIVLFCFKHGSLLGISTLAKNDPYPPFSYACQYKCLLRKSLEHLKETCILIHEDCRKKCYQEDVYLPCENDFNTRWTNHFSLAFSGYYQKASCSRNYDREKVPLGDLKGRWHMLGMLYGPVPTAIVPGAPVFPENLTGKRLGEAKTAIFAANLPPGPPANSANRTVSSSFILTDSTEEVGFFSVPIKYRKHGVRFEVCFQPFTDFGVVVQGGYADLKQTATGFINLTPPCTPCFPPMCNNEIANFLPQSPQFTCSVVTQINELLKNLRKLRELDKLDSIGIALRRFKSAYHGEPEDRLIDQMIAFESLYIGDERGIKNRLASRTASLLGESRILREQIINDMKEAYQKRCDIVHVIKEVTGEELRRIVPKAEDYLRQSIRRFLLLLSQGNSLKEIRENLLDENILKNGKPLALREDYL